MVQCRALITGKVQGTAKSQKPQAKTQNPKPKSKKQKQKPETKTWNLDEEGGSPWAAQTQILPPPAHSPLLEFLDMHVPEATP